MTESGCSASTQATCSDGTAHGDPFAHFARMIPNCLEYATQAKREGRPIVGILCEYTPRELIMAAGAVPVCLCAGSASTIPAAEETLPSNLCPLIKSTFGYHVKRSNPFLEMADLLVAETTCDGKKKMYELMGDTRPMLVLELPQHADDGDSLERWLRELYKLKAALEQRFKTVITECRLRAAIATMNRERALRRRLAGFMRADAPPLTGRQLLDLKSSISGLPADLAQYERAIAQLEARGDQAVTPPKPPLGTGGAGARGVCGGSASAESVSARSACAGSGGTESVSAGSESGSEVHAPNRPWRVRVLMTGVPTVHGAERVVELIENAGGLIVCAENCTGVKPILEDVNEDAPDLMRALAEKYYHIPCSVMTPNRRRMESLRKLAGEYRPDCVIELVWQACLTYDVESAGVKRLAEEELGVPYLKIVTDYSPSDSARIAVRIEALFETVRGAGGGCVATPKCTAGSSDAPSASSAAPTCGCTTLPQ